MVSGEKKRLWHGSFIRYMRLTEKPIPETGGIPRGFLNRSGGPLLKGMPRYTSKQAGAIKKTDDGYTYLNPARTVLPLNFVIK